MLVEDDGGQPALSHTMNALAQFEEAQRAIRRSEGYCELGMYAEAEQELESVPQQWHRTLPYLSARFVVCVQTDRMPEAVLLGQQILEEWPQHPTLWRFFGAGHWEAQPELGAE